LDAVRPFTRGIKLAGAGGGGFLILLARSDKAGELRQFLRERARATGGALYDWRIAREGLRTIRR
jgi:fucokinase / fucose-1-phosphate guanylyltransferase